jgi:hypothetical protein
MSRVPPAVLHVLARAAARSSLAEARPSQDAFRGRPVGSPLVSCYPQAKRAISWRPTRLDEYLGRIVASYMAR